MLYASRAMRQFVVIDPGRELVLDEITICKFWHLLEAHHLGQQLFARIGAYLAAHGMKVSQGTIVDATMPVRSHLYRKRITRRSKFDGEKWMAPSPLLDLGFRQPI